MKNSLMFAAMLVMEAAAYSQCASYTVPHLEDFQSITVNNQLPACWQSTSPGTVCLTYTGAGAPGNYAAFYYQPAGNNYFFSPGFVLYPGVTYSVSLWHRVSLATNSFSSLAIMIGSSQSTLGLTTVTATSGPPANTSYAQLSGTLSVASSGSYYFAVAAQSNSGGAAQYLYWDDFLVTMPCSLNSPTVSITASPSVACAGDTVNFQASGAHTFQWSDSDTGSVITRPVNFPWTPVTVIGTDTVTKCTDAASVNLTVHPKPVVSALASPQELCVGKVINIQAFGAQTYTWNNGVTGFQNTVTASAGATSFSVTGENQHGCKQEAVVQVTVHPLPVITFTAERNPICAGEQVRIMAAGGLVYEWVSTNNYSLGDTVTVKPSATTNYTLSVTDANQCKSSAVVTVQVNECLGIDEQSGSGLGVFPNPVSEMLFVAGNSGDAKPVLYDLGLRRMEAQFVWANGAWQCDVRSLSPGCYFLRVGKEGNMNVLTVLKAAGQ